MVMTEYFTIKRIDNSRLVRPMDAARMKDFWQRVAATGAIAACLLVYAWQHFECIQMRYQVQALEETRAKSAQLNQQLHVEVATLRSPGRVAAIAGGMGLIVPTPGQAAPADGMSDAVLAQARAVVQPQRP
jgi:cell division protein FtsL